jgi:hypothetical protein
MRFFSNENRESDDEPSNVDVQTRAEQENPDQAHDQHPERVESDPVAVPQQRSGSPWSDTPGAPGDNADAELADQERADGTDEVPAYGGDHRDDAADGPGDVDQDATGTVTGADHVHDGHDHAGPDHEAHDDAVDVPLDDAGASSDEATPGATESTTTTYGPDGTVTTTDGESATAADSEVGDSDARDSEVGDSDARDSEVGDSDARDSEVGDSEVGDSDSALKDEGGFDDPTAVDPATDKPLDTDDSDSDSTSAHDTVGDDTATPRPSEMALADTDATTDAETSGDVDTTGEAAGRHEAADDDESVRHDEPAAATNGAAVDDSTAPVVPIPVPVGADADRSDTAAGTSAAAEEDKLPGSVAEPDLSKVFSAEDAQSFQDRWRDVQLRFVDSPQEATADAASLLDEVVDKLASSLRAQKDSLSQDASNDTERLRVELRGYRELFTRVLGL